MKKVGKLLAKILLGIALLLLLFLAVSFVRHRVCLQREAECRTPLGELVEVDGYRMSVYSEGQGKHTLVFLSGGGTSSPILDFRSLYSLLNDEYRIAVVEKLGYGYSDCGNSSRDIETILRQTREALLQAGVTAPYVLCPHSMSGIEALYWAQQYPEEVEAIIGLDMAVPAFYESMAINVPFMKVLGAAASLGITRWLPGVAESDAIRYGTLSEEDQARYRAVFYSRTMTEPMIREMTEIKRSAAIVEAGGVPPVSMLLFVSDGTGGTGFDTETWRAIPEAYVAGHEAATLIRLDCPHYVHDHMYRQISEEIKAFLP